MRKRERFTQSVFVCLVSLLLTVPAWGQTFDFSISPTSQFIAEENFITLHGVTVGTASNAVSTP